MRGEIQQIGHGSEMVTENIRLCPDGVYRWFYELDMLRNPVILLSVWKVLGISFGAVFVLLLAADLFQGTLCGAADLWRAVLPLLILAAVFFVISIVSYLILAAMYGWKYIVLFEMTANEIRHIQMPNQFEKAQALGWLAVLAGQAAGPSVAGAGLSVASRSISTSAFEKVERIKARRRLHTIFVSERLERNQIYAADADFDFVESYLLAHCVKARVK